MRSRALPGGTISALQKESKRGGWRDSAMGVRSTAEGCPPGDLGIGRTVRRRTARDNSTAHCVINILLLSFAQIQISGADLAVRLLELPQLTGTAAAVMECEDWNHPAGVYEDEIEIEDDLPACYESILSEMDGLKGVTLNADD
jgi:hypothetical protein